MQAIAEASNLDGLTFRRSPSPGHVVSAWGGRVDILSADKSAGHASGYDDSLIDEIGLLAERDRDLVSGMPICHIREGRQIYRAVDPGRGTVQRGNAGTGRATWDRCPSLRRARKRANWMMKAPGTRLIRGWPAGSSHWTISRMRAVGWR